jgi:hypothetical protein
VAEPPPRQPNPSRKATTYSGWQSSSCRNWTPCPNRLQPENVTAEREKGYRGLRPLTGYFGRWLCHLVFPLQKYSQATSPLRTMFCMSKLYFLCNFGQIRSGGGCRVWYVLAWRNLLVLGVSEVPFLEEHARGSWQRPFDALWRTVSVALLILALSQWYLLR